MGMGSNLDVEKAEEEYRKQCFLGIMEEAAQFVVIDNLPREEAFQKARYLSDKREEAIRNGQYIELNKDDSLIKFIDESLEPTSVPSNKKIQVDIIAKELSEQFKSASF